jgi:NTP pyrophosphatase (non-canonical NTP hydrolase)
MSLTPDMTHTHEALRWRSAFGVATPDPTIKGYVMQQNLIEEEYREFLQAIDEYDSLETVETAAHTLKELADLVFVCYQFAAAKGWNLDLALTRVFESNMSKLDIDGLPIRRKDGKILKGPRYFEPQLFDLIP